MNTMHRYAFQVALFVILCWTAVCLRAQLMSNQLKQNKVNVGFCSLYQLPGYPRDCEEVYNECASSNYSSSVHLIKPDGYPVPFSIYCDNVNGHSWTVLLRRNDGGLGFKRGWEEYKDGFGFLSQEFWIGNEKLSYLTNQRKYELRFDVTYANGSSYYVNYDLFRITDGFGNYQINMLGQYTGNADALGKPGYQDSTSNDAPDGRAVDGNTDGQWTGYSCNYTQLGHVDLDVRTFTLPDANDSSRIVSWQLPSLTASCNITHQQLVIHQLDKDNCERPPSHEPEPREFELEPGKQTRSFSRLPPNSLFNITYLATNPRGTYVTSQFHRTSMTKPTGEPTNLRHTNKVYSVDLAWEAPPCGERNGQINQYEYVVQNQQYARRTRRTRYTIQPLSSGERWTFKVRACNEAGCGPYATSRGQLD